MLIEKNVKAQVFIKEKKARQKIIELSICLRKSVCAESRERKNKEPKETEGK